jgi:serine/threonine-protein kinase
MKTCPRCKGQFEDGVRFCPRDGIALPEVTDPLIGRVLLGQFEILASCGRGAMGTVYRARQTTMDRTVAIKVLRRDMLRDPAVVKRFHREARAVARLSHPNIVTVFLIGETDDGLPYLVMEFVEGESLGSVCQKTGPLPPTRAMGIARQIGSALGEAHAAGVVHRDLKPENITVATRRRTADFVKVLDFGIAKIVGGKSDVSHLTRTGAIFGTPHYIAPEQASGGEVDSRADLYSLGVILFRMLTGRLPFDASGGMQVLLAHIREQPPRPRDLQPDLSPELEQLVLRALAKDPAARWQSADDLCAAIDLLPEVREPAGGSPRATWAGVGAPALALMAPLPATTARPAVPAAAAAGIGPLGASQPEASQRRASLSTETSRGERRDAPDAVAAPSSLPSTVAASPDADSLGSMAVPPRHRGARLLGVFALVLVLAGGVATAVYVARDRVQARRVMPAVAFDAGVAASRPTADAGAPPPAPAPPSSVESVALVLEGYALRVSYPAHPTARTDTTFYVDVRDRSARPLESAKLTLGLRPPRFRPKDKELKCLGKASALPGRYAVECHLREAGSYHVHVYLQVGGEELQQGFDVVVADLPERDVGKGRGGRTEPGRGKKAAKERGETDGGGAPTPLPALQPPTPQLQPQPPPGPSPEPAWPPPPSPQEPPPQPEASAEPPMGAPPPASPPAPDRRRRKRPPAPDDIYQLLDGGV